MKPTIEQLEEATRHRKSIVDALILAQTGLRNAADAINALPEQNNAVGAVINGTFVSKDDAENLISSTLGSFAELRAKEEFAWQKSLAELTRAKEATHAN